MPRKKLDVEQIGWSEQIKEDISISGSLTVTGSIVISGLGTDSNVMLVGSNNNITSSNTLFIDEVNGRVGMNTSTPQEQFHIHGNNATLRLGNGNNSGEHSVKLELSEQADSSGNMNYGFSVGYNGSTNKFEIRKYANSTNGSNQLTIDRTSGNVVLTNGLHVSGATSVEDYMIISVTADNTDIQTGASQFTFRVPFAMELYQVPRASLSTASSSGAVTVDINSAGTTIFGTNLTIDVNETTSTTAATAAVLSTTSIADDAQITIDVDGAGTGARGLKITLYYRRTI